MVKFLYVFGLIILVTLAGCAAPSLKMPNEKLLKIGRQDGIVAGSVQIEIEEYTGRKLFKYKIDNKKCSLTIVRQRSDTDQNTKGNVKYEITALAGGEEVPFVAVLPAGRYSFKNVEIKIFGDPIRGNILASFDVIPGKKTYVGKLYITLPEYGRYHIRMRSEIKDTQESTLSKIESEYPKLKDNISKHLMVIGE